MQPLHHTTVLPTQLPTRWRWKFSPSGEKSGGKKENRKEEFLFFTFFTFLRNPPLKIFKFKMQPPSHHEHHTTVLLTRCPTQWWWFYWDWMSLIRMISFHGYQNSLSPTNFKAILRPLHSTSQDKTHTIIFPR